MKSSSTRSHALALVAALAALVAAAASACGSDAAPAPAGTEPGDASLVVDGAQADGAIVADSAVDAQPSTDASAPDTSTDDATHDAPVDVVNPYTDVFETYDAATDTAITAEGDTGAPRDSSAPPLDGDMILHD